MATTATISIASDIVPGFGGINESMTLTQAGTLTDIDSTTGFARRKLSATGAVDLVTMANELVEPKDSVAAKIYIRNIGYKGVIIMERVDIRQIRQNPDNPRVIKDNKFQKLVKSITELPQMLELRPIVVNRDMIVLGGNMRLKACEAAGLTEVPVVFADNLTPEQEREFIVKDNSSFGEWDWDLLANQWDIHRS